MGEPENVAGALIEIILVQRGSTAYLTIGGGADCSWLAAFAERVLLLDIAIVDRDGQTIHRSQSRRGATAQVEFREDVSVAGNIHMLEKTSMVSASHKFIQTTADFQTASSVSLRSSWSTILHDAFGATGEIWTSGKYSRYLQMLFFNIKGVSATLGPLYPYVLEGDRLKRPNFNCFYPMPDGWHLWDFTRSMLPELNKCSHVDVESNLSESIELLETLFRTSDKSTRCKYGGHHPSLVACHNDACLLALLKAILLFARILYISDIDQDVSPSSTGLIYLYKLYLYNSLYDTEEPGEGKGSVEWNKVGLFSAKLIHSTFSGWDYSQEDKDDFTPAISGRGICVYRKGIDDVTGDPEQIARFAVVRGYISYDNHRYRQISDLPRVHANKTWQCAKYPYASNNTPCQVTALVKDTANTRQLQLGYIIHGWQTGVKNPPLHIGLEQMIREVGKIPRGSCCGVAPSLLDCDKIRNRVHLQCSYYKPAFERRDIDQVRSLLDNFKSSDRTLLMVRYGNTFTDALEGLEIRLGQLPMIYAASLQHRQHAYIYNVALVSFVPCLDCILRRAIPMIGFGMKIIQFHGLNSGTQTLDVKTDIPKCVC